MDVGAINNHIMGSAFFLLFCSYMTAQNFATTLDPTLGPISLGILYLFWIIALLTISTSSVKFLSPKWAMLIGSITYPLYVSAGIELGNYIFIILYFIASALIGIGAAIVWVAQSVFIVQCCNIHENINNISINSKLGTFNGIFNLYLQFARFIGSLVAALIFQLNGSLTTMFIVMIGIGLAGSSTFAFIKKMEIPTNDDSKYCRVKSRSMLKTETETDNPVSTEFEMGIQDKANANANENENETADISGMKRFRQEMKDIILLWKNKTFLCLVPITFTFGLFMTFIGGDVATLITDNAFKFYVLTVEGFVAGLSSYIMGKGADKWGSLYFIIICCFILNGVYIFFYFWDVDQTAYWIWIIIAVLLGIGDGGILTLVPQMYPILLGDAPEVFANMRILQPIGLGIGFAYYPITTLQFRITFNIIFLTLGTFCVVAPKNIRKSLVVSC